MKKLTFFVIFTLFFHYSIAQENSSDGNDNLLLTIIDIQVKNKPLEQVLDKISKKYDIRFSYNPQSIPVDKPITLDFKSVPLQQTLDAIFKDTPIKYELIGQYIILTEDENKDEHGVSTIFNGRVFSQSDSLPLPLVHVYFEKDYVGVVSDYEGYFDINFKDYAPEDTLIFSMVGYQSQRATLETLISQMDFQLYLADSIYALEEFAIEAKQSKLRAFFQKLRLGKRISFMFKTFKVKIKRLFASINIPGFKEKLALRLRIKQLIAELQALMQELKGGKNEKKIQKILEQIEDLYKYT